MSNLVGVALLIATVAPTFAQLSADLKRKFDQADKKIVRLSPSAFPELPGNVVRELQRRGCTIPQEAFTKRRHNVVRGEFARPDQTDWAVLCSVGGSSSILVFWNWSEKNVAEIAKREDRNYLSGSRLGFSRGIPAGRDVIVRHHKVYGGPKLPPIVHQGIDDVFIEEAIGDRFIE